MFFVLLTALIANASPGPVPDPAWVNTLAPTLEACERRGTSELTTWACPELNFAVCHHRCDVAVSAIESSTTRRYQKEGAVEKTTRKFPVDGKFATVERTTWLQGRGAIVATLDVLHRDRDALVCGVSPMNPLGEHACDALFSVLVERDLTAPEPSVTPPPSSSTGQQTVEASHDPDDVAVDRTGTKTPELTDATRLQFAATAYKEANFSRAGALALQVVTSPAASDRERQDALLMTGAIHRLKGRDAQARAAFMRVLEDNPSASLPTEYPDKVRRLFDLVKEEKAKSRAPRPAPSSKSIGLSALKGCRHGGNGASKRITCGDVQLQWRVHESASDAATTLQEELMAYRDYTGVQIQKRYVECLIRARASRCIDMTVTAAYGAQRALLGYAEVNGKMLSVSCRWSNETSTVPSECNELISIR